MKKKFEPNIIFKIVNRKFDYLLLKMIEVKNRITLRVQIYFLCDIY